MKEEQEKEREEMIKDKWYVLYLEGMKVEQKILPSKQEAREYYSDLDDGAKILYHHGNIE